MKPITGIVAPIISVAEITRRVHLAHVAMKDAERAEDVAAKAADQYREQAARRRLDLGRALVEARKSWPARGPNAKGWGDFLRDQGIEERSARDWMQLAGHVEVSEPTAPGSEIPTRRQMQAERRASDEVASDDGPNEIAVTGPRAPMGISLVADEDEQRDALVGDEGGPPSGECLPYHQSSIAWERAHRGEHAIENIDVAKFNVVSENWADDAEQIAEAMIRSARSLFGNAERLDALCRQKSVAISSAKLASIPTHLLAAQAAIAAALRVFKGEAT